MKSSTSNKFRCLSLGDHHDWSLLLQSVQVTLNPTLLPRLRIPIGPGLVSQRLQSKFLHCHDRFCGAFVIPRCVDHSEDIHHSQIFCIWVPSFPAIFSNYAVQRRSTGVRGKKEKATIRGFRQQTIRLLFPPFQFPSKEPTQRVPSCHFA